MNKSGKNSGFTLKSLSFFNDGESAQSMTCSDTVTVTEYLHWKKRKKW